MGRRSGRQHQQQFWIAVADVPRTAAHPFYQRLHALLDEHGFDAFVESRCEQFYAPKMGRPSLPPGLYFRSLLIGYFEGIDSERGIGWRLADSLTPWRRRWRHEISGLNWRKPTGYEACSKASNCMRWLATYSTASAGDGAGDYKARSRFSRRGPLAAGAY